MEHIKLSYEEKQRLIEMLGSNNTEDHILAYGILNNLHQLERNNVINSLSIKQLLNYIMASHTSIKDFLSK